MKNRFCKNLCVGLTVAALSISAGACNQELPVESSETPPPALTPVGDLSVEFKDAKDGKELVLSGGWSTSKGALGVRVAYDTVDNVSEILYAHYESVVELDGGFLATARVTTPNKSVIVAADTLKTSGTKLDVSRSITVEEAGEGDLGFMTYFPLENSVEKKAEEYEWFCPSNYYGNDSYTFSGAGVKTGFTGEQSIVTADNMGAPVLAAFDGKTSFSLMDKTAGMRETSGEDLGVRVNRIVVDERLNMPGIGLCNTDGTDGTHAGIFHAYPAYSYNYIAIFPFHTQYRMLPVTEDLTREVAFEIERSGEYENLAAAATDAWRKSYAHYAVTDKRYAATDVKDTLLRNVNNSFGVSGGMPQYMINADHFEPESGFLYRNADLAWLLLAEGRRTLNESYVNNALAVLNSQVAAGRLDENLIFGGNTQHYNRASSDALVSLIWAYKTELSYGIKHNDWLNYLLRRADAHMDSRNWMDVNFFTELAKLTGAGLFIEKAAELAESVIGEHKKFIFKGAITNPAADPIVDRESGILAMRGYIDLYELTGQAKWLDMAETAALFVESMHQIQPINLEPFDCTGVESDITSHPTNQGYLGNGRVMPYGLSYISGQTTSADLAGVLAAPDFYRLYKYTRDEHYYDFYDYVTYNATLYVNMGDKVGMMDDVVHSTGLGFINEYIGLAVGDDPAVYRRGSMHDSNIAWVPFAILQNYERTYQILKEPDSKDSRIVAGDDIRRGYNLAKNKYVTETAEGYIFDLNEYCNVETVKGLSGQSVRFSKDGETFFAGEGAEGTAAKRVRYVQILTETELPENLEIIGLPLTYEVLSYGAGVTENGGGNNPAGAVDAHNYVTSYTPKAGCSITLDFGSAKEIYQAVVRFKTLHDFKFVVEVSSNGEQWTTFASFVGAKTLYAQNGYASGVRYVRLTFIEGAMAEIQDFKVLGL